MPVPNSLGSSEAIGLVYESTLSFTPLELLELVVAAQGLLPLVN